ncbi:MAG: CDP-diacylglycerol--glycerol-3-phosphate 3-phosphatidyltransferase [Deltaproteobacteria bacterium]|jgi:CDP-diacylglycerol--glycerol-3-phosphate 3-phosphatidyltransferase|nr:CDP-diacylglycerol--glycerol-3-phosphate 3-phosphatidyltransferase [Deltaproteobacteria bacterium]
MRSILHSFFSRPSLPNILTSCRMLAVVAVVLGLELGPRLGIADRTLCAAVALFYLAAALSDLLDGYLARRYRNESNLGRFLDPMADKLLVSSALIMLIPTGRVQAWVAFLILAREMAITALRGIAAEQGLVIAASTQGKQKTFAQNTALFCLLWNYQLLWANTHRVGTVMLYVALAATYWSGILYFRQFLLAASGKAGTGTPEHFKRAASAAPLPEAAVGPDAGSAADSEDGSAAGLEDGTAAGAATVGEAPRVGAPGEPRRGGEATIPASHRPEAGPTLAKRAAEADEG